jgi:hypothetical protein
MAAGVIIDLAEQIRKDHPRMGCRKMYWKSFQNMPLGRDQSEKILLSEGFRVQFPKNFKRTTYSIGKLFYPNRIEGLILTRINQVWQSDITYFELHDGFYYLVFIQDIYSRRIVGWSVDRSLWAQANLGALRKATQLRGGGKLEGLIHHSDRGSQYIDKEYIHLLQSHGITPSMCKHAWQNAYCERVNGIIKNEYLAAWSITDYAALKKATARAVWAFNHSRPHTALPRRMSPIAFEEELQTGALGIDFRMSLYSTPSQLVESVNSI